MSHNLTLGGLPVLSQVLLQSTALVVLKSTPEQAPGANNSDTSTEQSDPAQAHGPYTVKELEEARRVAWTFATYVMQCSSAQRVVLIHAGVIPPLLQVGLVLLSTY